MIAGTGFLGAFDLERIVALPLIRRVEFHEAVASTNDLALRAAADPNLPLPALILAGCQTAGRGRGGNRWWSAPGALTFSLLLEPARVDLAVDRWPRLSLTTAVAVCDALTDLAPAAAWGAKWPNDVVGGGRKVCGILVEAPNHGSPTGRRVVVGVGLNVNNSWTGAPDSLRNVGTAVCDMTHQQHDLTDVLARYLSAFADRLDQLSSSDPRLPAAWRSRCVLTGRQVRIDIGSGAVAGRCRGIDDDGALAVETLRGLKRVHGGVVVSVT